MSKSKLDQTLNIEELDNIHDELKVQLPDDPSLRDVANIALKHYKEQMEDIVHIEPKNRQRHLEVACQYLNVAKEAIRQDEELRIKENKEMGVYKSMEKEVGEEQNGKYSRNELLKQRRQHLSVKDGSKDE